MRHRFMTAMTMVGFLSLVLLGIQVGTANAGVMAPGGGVVVATLVPNGTAQLAPATAQQQNAPLPAGTCFLTVPADPLTAAGLATPYVLSGNQTDSGVVGGCTEPNPGTGAFVQAAILSPTGQPMEYDPLVITANTEPQVAPVLPVIPDGSSIAIWIGFNDINVQLIGPGAASFINGLPATATQAASNFGQEAWSTTAPAFFATANADIAAGMLTVPPIGLTGAGTDCPTINSFQIGDEDPSDNEPDLYLTNGVNVAQDTAINQAVFPGDTLISNGSDNLLLDHFVDPALDTEGGACTPWQVPSLDNPGTVEPTLAFDQLQGAAVQLDPLVTELSDEMTLADPDILGGVEFVGIDESVAKDMLYRAGVDQLPADYTLGDPGSPTETAFCNGLIAVFPPFLMANEVAFANSPSPTPGQNLANFMAQRFAVATFPMPLPAPGVNPTCTQATGGVPDPVVITATDGNGNATAFSVFGIANTAMGDLTTPTSAGPLSTPGNNTGGGVTSTTMPSTTTPTSTPTTSTTVASTTTST